MKNWIKRFLHNCVAHPLYGIFSMLGWQRLAELAHSRGDATETTYLVGQNIPLHHLIDHPLSMIRESWHNLNRPVPCKPCWKPCCDGCPTAIKIIGSHSQTKVTSNFEESST